MPNQIAGRRNQIKAKENTLERDAQRVKEEWQETLSVLDYSYICSLFLIANDESNLDFGNIQR